MKVLITCGPTWVAIDRVRVISNVSSGEMGHLIAKAFRQKKATVTVIEGPVTHAFSDKKVKIIKYRFFDEMAAAVKKELLKKYDVIVHAAAVSDFKVIRPSKGKISSDQAVTLNLTPTEKIIKAVKRLSPRSFLVGFKLDPGLNSKNVFKVVRPLFKSAGCDLVVANTLKTGYRGFIVDPAGEILSRASSKKAIAQRLVNLTVT